MVVVLSLADTAVTLKGLGRIVTLLQARKFYAVQRPVI